MYGLEQGGIAATVQYVLSLFDAPTQERLVANVFLTGGPSSLPGLKPRIERDLLATRPFQSYFSVSMAKVGQHCMFYVNELSRKNYHIYHILRPISRVFKKKNLWSKLGVDL